MKNFQKSKNIILRNDYFDDTDKWYVHKFESVQENKVDEILWGDPIQPENEIELLSVRKNEQVK